MPTNFKRIARIHKVRQFTTYGYIRRHQEITDMQLTEDIISICLLFYANDLIDDLFHLAYGDEDEWRYQQQQIKDYFKGKGVEYLRQMKKNHFARKIRLISHLSLMRAGKLSNKLRNSLSEADVNNNDLLIADMIIAEISSFRDDRKEQIKTACFEANINPNSWLTAYDANQFLMKRELYRSRIAQRFKIITTYFDANNFIHDLFDLVCGSDKEWIQQQKQIERIDITQMNKTEFAREIVSIVYFPTDLCGKLFQKLISKATENKEFIRNFQCDLIIQDISAWRQRVKEKVLNFCIGFKQRESLSTEEFLLNKLKLPLQKIRDINRILRLSGGSSIR